MVAGVELATTTNSRITAETFLKRYADYPFLLREGISLANLGADFGVIGNAPSVPTSRGRAYGFELLAQQRLYHGWYGIAAYTFVRSAFTTRDGSFQPSAWDNRHLVSLTGGRRFSKGRELGVRWRYLGGAPYTPDNVALSAQADVWDVTGRGVPDYGRLNAERNGPLHQLDVRFDKRWFRRGSAIDLYLDVQNLYAFQPRLAPILIVDRDAAGNPIPIRRTRVRIARTSPATTPVRCSRRSASRSSSDVRPPSERPPAVVTAGGLRVTCDQRRVTTAACTWRACT
jgi:hypothetical protein